MKKYRCPHCKEVFTGTPDVCPKCGVKLRYADKEKPKEVVEATTINNFSFNDPDVVKHDDKVAPVTSADSIESMDEPENRAPITQAAAQALVNGESYFDGRMIQRVGIHLLWGFIFLITATLAFPWCVCAVTRWETKHTIIQGHRLKFTGKGIQLLGRFLLWLLLFILTVGIILLWVQIFLKQWKVKHTEFAD